jgi:hypothetical protein
MILFDDMSGKFSNHRHWQDFVAAIHESMAYPYWVTYPMVLGALRSGQAWFTERAVRRPNPNSCGCAVKS